MIVNIGCDIAQQRIATPDDIDGAVTLGLGYPQGPLAFGDAPRRPQPCWTILDTPSTPSTAIRAIAPARG
jgi:hypothetical protein